MGTVSTLRIIIVGCTGQLPIFVLKASVNSLYQIVCLEIC